MIVREKILVNEHDLKVRTTEVPKVTVKKKKYDAKKSNGIKRSHILHLFYNANPAITIMVLRKVLRSKHGNLQQTADYFGVSYNTVRNYLAAPEKPVKVAKKTKVNTTDPKILSLEDKISKLEYGLDNLRKALGVND